MISMALLDVTGFHRNCIKLTSFAVAIASIKQYVGEYGYQA
jgi:hypothetical protein